MMDTTLVERVEGMVEAHKKPLLSTTSQTEAIAELAARLGTLEQAIRVLAIEFEKLSNPARSLLQPSARRRFRRSTWKPS